MLPWQKSLVEKYNQERGQVVAPKTTQPTEQPAAQPETPGSSNVDALSKMGNYDRITPFEKSVYGFLPKIGNSTVVKKLDEFNKTWAGKALNWVFDITAEGLERVIGTGAQAIQYAQKNNDSYEGFDWKDAWYAGSLYYDSGSLPGLSYDDKGKVNGLKVYDDLGGMSALVMARQKLAAGMSLTDVKAEYYNGLGALQLRAQLQDALFHAVADPTNLLLPMLKPVDRLKAISEIAQSTKVLEATKAASLAENTAIRAAKALELEAAIAEKATIAIDKVDDIAKVAKKIESLTEDVSTIDKALRNVESLPTISRFEKFAMWATGGNPLEPNKFTKTPIGKLLMKPFELTPESKAREAMDILQNGIGTHVVQTYYNSANAEEDAVKAMTRIATQAKGPEFANMMLTPMGQQIQSLTTGSQVVGEELLKVWKATNNERTTLNMIADALGMKNTEVMKFLGNDKAEEIMTRLSDVASAGGKMSETLRGMMGDGRITAETLASTAKILEGLPYDREQFFAHLINGVSEVAMKQAIVKFGVTNAKNLPQRLASAMKTAETLAFIRINPANMVRNAINNEITMISRGTWGLQSIDNIESFFKASGWIPTRLNQGFGMSQEAGEVLDGAEKILSEAVKGQYGIPEKMSALFNKAGSKLGVFDMSNISRKLEAHASARAYYNSYGTFMNEFAKYAKPEDFFDAGTLKALETSVPGLTRQLENAVKDGAFNPAKLRSVLEGSSFTSVEEVVDDVKKATGLDINAELGQEIMTTMRNGWDDAVKNGKTDELFMGIQEKMQTHIDDLVDNNIKAYTESVKNQALIGGPNSWYQTLGDTVDRWHSAELQHRMRISDLAEMARTEKDPEKLNALWNKINTDEQNFFKHIEKMHNAALDGLKQANVEIEAKFGKMPDIGEMQTSFNEVRSSWKKFFSDRQSTWNDFYKQAAGLKDTERNTLYDKITRQLERDYLDVVEEEAKQELRMDEVVSKSISDPAMQKRFNNWRDAVADIHRKQREGVVNMHASLNKAKTAMERKDIYNKYMSEYAELEEKSRKLDAMGHSMMQNDPIGKVFDEGGSPLRNEERDIQQIEKNSNTVLNPKHEASIYKKYPDKKGNTYLIDVGSFDADGKWVGKIDPQSLKPKQILVTPDNPQEANFTALINKIPAESRAEMMEARKIAKKLPAPVVEPLDPKTEVVDDIANNVPKAEPVSDKPLVLGLSDAGPLGSRTDRGLSPAMYERISEKLGGNEKFDAMWKDFSSHMDEVTAGAQDELKAKIASTNESNFDALLSGEKVEKPRVPSIEDITFDNNFIMWSDEFVQKYGISEQDFADFLQSTDPGIAKLYVENYNMDLESRIAESVGGKNIGPSFEEALRSESKVGEAPASTTNGYMFGQDGKAKPIVYGTEGYRAKNPPTPQQIAFREKGGWKLHLQVDSDNYAKVDRWLDENHPGEYKLLQGGEPGEKDFTVYVGSKDDAETLANKIEQELKGLVNENPIDDTEQAFTPHVQGRFDSNNTKGQQMFGERMYYGTNGVPSVETGSMTQFSDWYELTHGQMSVKDYLNNRLVHQKKIEERLVDAFGDYYTGKSKKTNISYPEVTDEVVAAWKKRHPNIVDIGEQAPASNFQAVVNPQDPNLGLVNNDIPQLVGYDEMAQQQRALLDRMAESAKKPRTSAKIDGLTPELQQKVSEFLDYAEQQNGGLRFAANRYAEYGRDSALLNYNRKTNFDSWMSTVFPYSYWTTASMVKWGIHTIDRPAMFSTYLRIKKLLATAGAPESGFPTRMKDNIKIRLPFVPDWMGDQFINPLKVLLPFDSFAQPYEQLQQNTMTLNGRAERLLQQQLQDGTINQSEYNQAITHQGTMWDQAVTEAKANDSSLNYDAWDFATTMTSPHAPILWAVNALRGTPNEIGPFSPLSITAKNVATTLGVKDWNNSSLNVEGRIRKSLGLPAFNQWDDYYVDRMLSNMAGTGEYSVADVQAAMVLSSQVQQGQITSAQAVEQNKVYQEATYRANQEQSGGAVGTVLRILGIPVKSYPTGEKNLRSLQDKFTAAYTTYHEVDQQVQAYIDAHPEMDKVDATTAFYNANPSLATKAGALTDFFNRHPEYEARLGLWDKPEVRIQKFMVDNVWSLWNSMPKLWQNEAKSQLGSDFVEQFLNSDTRNTDNIPVERLAVWMKLMGGDPPGTLKATTATIGRLNLADKDVALRVQTFYDSRTSQFPDYYKLQQQYYSYAEGSAARKTFLRQNPSLKAYWSWRDSFMSRNPDVVPYLSDTPPVAGQYKPAYNAPQFTWAEWKTILPTAAQQLILSYYQNGDELPASVTQQLDILADNFNISGGGTGLLKLIGESLR